jgi:hypothetical protein
MSLQGAGRDPTRYPTEIRYLTTSVDHFIGCDQHRLLHRETKRPRLSWSRRRDGIEVDVPASPSLELEVSGPLGIDLGVEPTLSCTVQTMVWPNDLISSTSS